MWLIRQLSVESGSMRMSSSSVKIGLANLPEGRGESTKWSISPCLHPKVSSFDNRFLILRMERRGSRSPGCQAPVRREMFGYYLGPIYHRMARKGPAYRF